MQVTPSDLKINILSEDQKTGTFSIEPLPTGLGYTVAHSLRRVLLTSLSGAAITQVKINNATHQFTTIEGVKEDVVDITLSLKKIRVKMHGDTPIVGTLEKKGPGKVTAGDIQVSGDIEILNKDLEIANLSDAKSALKMEVIFETGIGYSPMEERQSNKVGVIVLDALYSPVINATYTVEPARFGKDINLDKVNMTITTDGSISPSEAVKASTKILADYFSYITNWEPQTEQEESEATAQKQKVKKTETQENVLVDELPLQTRTINALKKQGINTLQQLIDKNDEQLSDIKNLGEKSVEEIKKLLKKEGYR